MNYIFMGESYISAFTDSIDAELHKHHMLQLFISYKGNLTIGIKGKNISCRSIILNSDVEHTFSSNDTINFTMLIDVTSDIAQEFRSKYLSKEDYFILDCEEVFLFQETFKQVIQDLNKEKYIEFTFLLFNILGIKLNNRVECYERIIKLLKMIDSYDYEINSLEEFSKIVSLSESRLSHLFKEQVGIPLKSYIVLCKLKRAYMYLLENGNITDAALKSGFDSASHFAYTSKKLTGMSAKNIRKDSVFLKVYNFEIQ